jgi:hypothetical protein
MSKSFLTSKERSGIMDEYARLVMRAANLLSYLEDSVAQAEIHAKLVAEGLSSEEAHFIVQSALIMLHHGLG